MVEVDKVRTHLARYGLTTKDPVPLTDARVLGLRVNSTEDGIHRWTRDGALPIIGDAVTKRELFSLFGKLIGHYPVAGWLRTACSYVKRLTNMIGWDDTVSEGPYSFAKEILDRVQKQDPVTGVWQVPLDGAAEVWCDASNLAVACCLQVDGEVVEDAAWLRKENDGTHINVAELEAVVKGLNLVLRWCISKVEVVTDSASVYNWVTSVLEDSHRPRVSGLSEMVIRRRLGIIAQLIEEYSMDVSVRLVPSAGNLADTLTRIPRSWIAKVVCDVRRY